MGNDSGIGVLDKAATVLGALEAGPLTLAGLVQALGDALNRLDQQLLRDVRL